MSFSFASSLSQITRYNAEAQQRRAQSGLPADRMTLGAGVLPIKFQLLAGRHLGRGASTRGFRDNQAGGDLDGYIGFVSVGADYVLSPSLLFGMLVQFDSMRQRSELQAAEASGVGWMAGPYATVRLSEERILEARAAWGQSYNEVSPFLTYTDEFDTNRWLVFVAAGRAVGLRGVDVQSLHVGRLYGRRIQELRR
ncbi:MAG: autotransporter domain-containing protein [Hyphomicrobium sp.]